MMMMSNNNSGEAKTASAPDTGDDEGGGGAGDGVADAVTAAAATTVAGVATGATTGSEKQEEEEVIGDIEVNIRRGLDVIQSMIDISADRLEGLRTQCATSAELTQQEIRTLETKLVKLFSDLLITKSKLPERLPARGLPATGNELKQWLRVVGLSCTSLNSVIQQVSTLEGLLAKDDKELRTIMVNDVYVREEEIKRLTRACSNLKYCREQLEAVADGRKVTCEPHDLFWDSWDRQPVCHRTSPRVSRSMPGAGAKCGKSMANYRQNNGPVPTANSGDQHHITSPQTEETMINQHHYHHQYQHAHQHQHEQLLNPHHTISPDEASTSGCTPSPSPPNSPSNVLLQGKQQAQQQQQQQNRKGFPTTPPPKRKHQTTLLASFTGSASSPSNSVPTGGGIIATSTTTTSSSASSSATGAVASAVSSIASCTVDAATSSSAASSAAAALTKSKSHESQFGGGGSGAAATGNPHHQHQHHHHHHNNNNNHTSAAAAAAAAATAATSNNNNGGGGGSGSGGGSNNSGSGGPASHYHINNNNNIPSNVVSLVSHAESGGAGHGTALTVAATTNVPILCDPMVAAQTVVGCGTGHNYRATIGNGSAGGTRIGTFPRSRLNTEPTFNSTATMGGGGSGPPLLSAGDHLHGGHPHPHHYHHHHHQLHQFHQPSDGRECGGEGPVGPSPPFSHSMPPKSPCTPINTRGMGHIIQHRFTKRFKVTKSTCMLCNKQMFIGFKCTECKYRCHKDCKSNVPPSCGLPPEFVDEFKRSLQSDTLLPSVSPNIGRGTVGMYGGGIGGSGGGGAGGKQGGTLVRGAMGGVHPYGPDSSSAGSSCNSSSPSSPALLSLPPQTPGTSKYSSFNFPEVANSQQLGTGGGGGMLGSMNSTTSGSLTASGPGGNGSIVGSGDRIGGGITIVTHPIGGNATVIGSGGGTMGSATSATGGDAHEHGSGMGSMGYRDSNPGIEVPKLEISDIPDRAVLGGEADKTGSASATSTDSSSDRTPIRLDSTEERDHESSWPRQNSLSLKEWDIPYDDLHLKEKIGNGRFGTVHRALWHGDVAVKLLKEDYVADDRTLEAFKLEVATFKKTRHENVVLFMGACMKPPRLAIVTSLCKGNTLFTHIHLRKDKFNLNRTTLVAQQISQGMGYLHARGIVHKDLKTKNIFLENGKVIITDFGLFSATKLQYCELGLGIPGGWLCYLAPELMRNLTPYRPIAGDLPFSRTSDIYAFGTVWYELLCGEFPFKSQPAESIIWQVGRGMKQTLANLQASRDVKDILIQCWSYHSDDRPDFAKLLNQLERLPKKRLARSPSHPVQLSRSAESVF
ncbi:kinase suppressor of Ras 1-like [Anopheles albimanus]|uniref:Kinase suppressor of Ras 2 n=1 Tax=Anopheles albimanus TaxID=7167 RepID=A0A182FRS6_ANOAL|nr:kinase suppressor of Ras 1-like [Anopheles albimanus]